VKVEVIPILFELLNKIESLTNDRNYKTEVRLESIDELQAVIVLEIEFKLLNYRHTYGIELSELEKLTPKSVEFKARDISEHLLRSIRRAAEQDRCMKTSSGSKCNQVAAEIERLRAVAEYLERPDVLLIIPQPHRMELSKLLHGED
jgi:hypothetical protein